MEVNKEKRLTNEANLESTENKVDETTEQKTISGYALKFGKESKDLGGFIEVITPEALKEVDLSDVYLLQNHDYSKPLASTKAGTLKLTIDEVGLRFEATLNDTSYAKDVFENVQKGLVDSMSFGFTMGLDSFDKKESGEVVRSIEAIKNLNEISVVTVPAYNDTNVQVDKRSYEAFMDNHQATKTNESLESTSKTQKETKNMKTLIDNEQTETRNFENFIRSYGEERDGLTTQNTSVVIPKDVIGEVFQLKRANQSLIDLVTVKEVSNGQGKYPIATNPQTAILATKEELAEIEDIEAEMFKQVEYNVKTRAGKIALSNEVIEDSAVNIVAEVKSQLAQLVVNTDNQNIIKLLKTFKKVPATTLDDLKKVFNVELDPALTKTVVTNQTGFNHLDTMKDSQGRYILQPDVTAPSGYALFGAPLQVLSDKLLTNTGKAFPLIMGDLKQAVFVARRNQVTTQWEKFDFYSQGLAVITRSDYQKIDEEAVRYVEFTPATGE